MPAELPVIGDLKLNALEYAASGLEVFPVAPRDGYEWAVGQDPKGAKAPIVSQYQATTDTKTIVRWWDRWPDALIGHRLPADQLVIDVDPRHGGADTWRRLRDELDFDTKATRVHISGRNDGGGHVTYLHPGGRLTIRKLDQWAKARGVGESIEGTEDKWVCGLDILHRSHRYTILPPSPHPETGQPYRWHQWTEPAEMPPALAELLIDTSPPPPPYEPKEYDGDSIADWYSETKSWTEILPRHGWSLRAGNGDEDGSQWRHPGATSAVSATTRHGCLFVYSPNTPFDVTEESNPKGVTRFAAFTELDHEGDATEAARAAREMKDGPATKVSAGDPFGRDLPSPAKPTEEREPAEVDADPDDVDEERKPSTWTPVDLSAALAGIDVPAPDWWRRTDGTPLVYAGRTHWFQGPSESLKSMAAQAVVVEALDRGFDVLYIDFEDDDRGVVARLLAMGAEAGAIADQLVYVRPDEALMDRKGKWTPGGLDYLETLALRPWGVAILDGVTEAMTTEGMELLDNADTARWMRLLPKRIADTGAAVIVIDHTTKNAESAGRFAIGAQHKLAGVTGATYKFETIRPLARATSEEITGQVKIEVTKDRPGWVRGRCKEGFAGTLEVTSYPDGGLAVQMSAPGAESNVVDMELIAEILEYLKTYEGATGRKIEEAVDARGARVRGAIQAAIGRGWVSVKKVGAGHQHTLTDAGRDVMK